MLSNLIGVVLAFMTIMLMLSLVVMALVQFTQSVLRLRGRNLLVGIAGLLDVSGLSNSIPAPERSRLRTNEKCCKAAHVLNETTAANLTPKDQRPNSPTNVIRGPKVSWVDADDLVQAVCKKVPQDATTAAVAAAHEADGTARVMPDPAKVKEHFKKLEPAMADRYATIMRRWTVAWAIVVAIAFQVSTPDLLNSLLTSDTRRAAVLAVMPEVVRQSEAAMPAARSDDFVDRALAELTKDYPGHEELFAQVSGGTDSPEEMLDELRNALAGVSERDVIVARYAVIVGDGTKLDVSSAIARAGTAIDGLDVIDIRPWGKEDFYNSSGGMNWPNILGVLMTAILLSFGAPFWFERLKEVASLQETLKSNQDKAKRAV